MENSQSQPQGHDIELGLKSLTLCCPINDQKLHHNCRIMASNLRSPPPSPVLSHIGDYIGMESCLNMRMCKDVQMMNVNNATTTSCRQVRSKRDSRKKAREFPPPISLLARTENLSSHMRFVLKRFYTNDGRLILREERVRHHEYFRAHRSNGHLTLQLVPLDEDESFSPFDDEDEYEQEHAQESEVQVEANVEEEEIEGSVNQIPESCNDNKGIEIGGNGNGGAGMCLKYDNVIISSSCYLGPPVVAPAIKPVHT